MSQKARSVTLSHTIYQWLEVLVNSGEYSSLDDAATDLLMQVKRGTPLVPQSTAKYSPSTPQVHTSTHTKPIAVEPTKSSLGPTIAATSESPADELARLQALPKLQKLKHMNRITELKELIEA